MTKTTVKNITERAYEVSQPMGGYLPPRRFERISLPGGGLLPIHRRENVSPRLVEETVLSLARLMTGEKPDKAFARLLALSDILGQRDRIYPLLTKVRGLDDDSIAAAFKIVGVDCYEPPIPDKRTTKNVRTLVERLIDFHARFGKKVMEKAIFEGGYTSLVSLGECDLVTTDAIWLYDFSTSLGRPNTQQTLQLLMYWRMGLHSIYPEFQTIRYLGIYNPRLNTVYRLDVNAISPEIISTVEREVIGY